ncbi:Lrp/AsnC family transcriptional regulator [Candidatus Woesearchaeota archaeon]|jgi:DNA-binding Lrp family transcriptional regulator|nr:Lrp/AsnC family transcriptional regulator [Candidatus Woesearchaeota archaeon]
MSKLNDRILYFLDRNSRATLSKIARSLKTSEQRISYAVKSMRKKRQIKFYSTVFDYSKFDFNGYLVLFQMYRGYDESINLVSKLKEIPEVVQIETLQGKFDTMTLFLSPNPSSFNKILKQFISEHKELIKNNYICTVIVTHKFGRSYLNPWAKSKIFGKIIGGDRAPVKLSDSEALVCKYMLDNPTITLKDLAKGSGLTFKTIVAKLKSLKKEKIIRKFEPVLDGNKLGIFNKKIFLKYASYDVDIDKRLIGFCRMTPEVVSITKIFGSWDMIINFESLKEGKFDIFVQQLRAQYESIIEDFEIVGVKSKEKFNYLPSDYFS